ncbi:MAG: hypothetical protein ICV63_03105 [Coleofasciculus sp. Co-bin14]|nr:hypothetical protein [Coleofasciculus sp. Co-bin14]
MDETIRINPVQQSDWNETIEGIQANQVKQVWQVCGVDGQIVGIICETVEEKFLINGQPEVEYVSLQAAAGAIIKGDK